MLPPPPDLETSTCLACDNLALWCVEHCSNTEIQSGLCATHFETLFGACQYCFQPADDAELTWKPCNIDGCLRSVRVCEKCASSLEDPSLICEPCGRAKGSLSVICHETPSQSNLRYARRCKACFLNIDNATKRVLVQAESEAYLQSISQQQEWTGYEHAMKLPCKY